MLQFSCRFACHHVNVSQTAQQQKTKMYTYITKVLLHWNNLQSDKTS